MFRGVPLELQSDFLCVDARLIDRPANSLVLYGGFARRLFLVEGALVVDDNRDAAELLAALLPAASGNA